MWFRKKQAASDTEKLERFLNMYFQKKGGFGHFSCRETKHGIAVFYEPPLCILPKQPDGSVAQWLENAVTEIDHRVDEQVCSLPRP